MVLIRKVVLEFSNVSYSSLYWINLILDELEPSSDSTLALCDGAIRLKRRWFDGLQVFQSIDVVRHPWPRWKVDVRPELSQTFRFGSLIVSNMKRVITNHFGKIYGKKYLRCDGWHGHGGVLLGGARYKLEE